MEAPGHMTSVPNPKSGTDNDTHMSVATRPNINEKKT